MKLRSLEDLLMDQLKDLYHAENQITKALPKMAKAASTPDLRDAFQEHLQQTEQQIERLEQAFAILGVKARGKKCEAMEGLIKEGSELIKEEAEAAVKDAGLIGAAQKVEHYEMAGYGCVRTWARQLGLEEVADLMQETLQEEEDTDMKLTRLAENMVNLEAAHAS